MCSFYTPIHPPSTCSLQLNPRAQCKAPQPFQMDTQLCPCASGHFIFMPWTAPTHNFFLENQNQPTQRLKFWNVCDLRHLSKLKQSQELHNVLRRCQEHSLNLGRSFSVTNTKANKNQIQRILR